MNPPMTVNRIFSRALTLLLAVTLMTSLLPLNSVQPATYANTTAKLSVGDYIQFGTYNNQPILWRIIHWENNRDPILLADRILTLKALDGAGAYHNADPFRKSYGSNNYAQSNLRQWLNSSSNTVNWTQNSPETEYNPYNNERGFLAPGNFTDSERNLLRPMNHRVLLANVDTDQKDGGNQLHIYDPVPFSIERNYNSAFYQNVTDRVFLLSAQQLKQYIHDNRDILGPNYHVAKPTLEAVLRNKFQSALIRSNRNWYYWLNTPSAMSSHQTRSVASDGKINHSNAYNDLTGVRPAIHFNVGLAKFSQGGTGTADNPHMVVRNNSLQPASDNRAPSTPQNLRIANSMNRMISVSWEHASDNVGIAGYDLLIDSKKIASTRNNEFTFFNLKEEEDYPLTVRAYDAAGNRSPLSSTLLIEPNDSTPPTMPRSLTAESITESSIYLTWKESTDQIGVSGYRIFVNGELAADTKSAEPVYELTGLEPFKSYQVRISAYDAAGNQSPLSIVRVIRTADVTPPTPPAGVKVDVIDGLVYQVMWEQSMDNGVVAGYHIFLNGRQVGNRSVSRNADPAEPVTHFLTKLPHGSHRIQIKAFDSAGNKSEFSNAVETLPSVRVDRNNVYVNGRFVNMGISSQPVVESGALVVSSKPLLESMGMSMQWFSGSNMIVARSANKTVTMQMTVGSRTAIMTTNGRKVNKTMPAAPVVRNGNVFIPIKFIADELGYRFMAR